MENLGECLNPCRIFKHLDIFWVNFSEKAEREKIKKLLKALINNGCRELNKKCLRMSKRVLFRHLNKRKRKK